MPTRTLYTPMVSSIFFPIRVSIDLGLTANYSDLLGLLSSVRTITGRSLRMRQRLSTASGIGERFSGLVRVFRIGVAKDEPHALSETFFCQEIHVLSTPQWSLLS